MSEEIDRLRVKCTGSGEIEVCCHPDVDDQPIGHKDRECVLDTGQGAPGCDIATDEKLSCKTKCPFWKARPATTPEGLAPEEGLLLIDELTALRAQVSQLTAEVERLETCVGWLADVSAATAYDFACKKSTGRGERRRQISIMEKTIAMLDGSTAPSVSAQIGVRARCQRTITELAATLSTIRKDGP